VCVCVCVCVCDEGVSRSGSGAFCTGEGAFSPDAAHSALSVVPGVTAVAGRVIQ